MTRQLSLPSAGARRCAPRSPRPAPRRRRDQRGAALVEFSLVIGVFVMVLYGLIYFGMALATKQQVTNAAAEGARAAVGAVDDDTAKQTAVARVVAALGVSNGRYAIGPGPGEPAVGPCSAASPLPKCITVTVTYDWENHPVVPPAPGLGIVPLNQFDSTAIVQY